MYEGTPDTPHRGRFWELVEKYGVTILYTAPTAIRTFAKWGDDIPAQFDLSSLRLLGSVGEPINPEAWMWYRDAHRRRPLPDRGHLVADRDRRHHDLARCPGSPRPSPARRCARCPASPPTWSTTPARRCRTAAAATWCPRPVAEHAAHDLGRRPALHRHVLVAVRTGMYFAGDGAKRDDDGDLWLLGRVDDVMLVSGHNISTTEVESALVSHPKVAESAVVGATDPTTGQAIVAFVILRGGARGRRGPGRRSCATTSATTLGPIAKPRQILLVAELPKTRSGKIMRRLLRDVAENRSLGDVTTLQDSTVMDLISAGLKTDHDDGGLTGWVRAGAADRARRRLGRHEGGTGGRIVRAPGRRLDPSLGQRQRQPVPPGRGGIGPAGAVSARLPGVLGGLAAPARRPWPAPGSGRSRWTCAATAPATSPPAATTATPWRPTSPG